MALARLALKNLGRKAVAPWSNSLAAAAAVSPNLGDTSSSSSRSVVISSAQKQRWGGPELLVRWLSTSAADEKVDGGREVAASSEEEGGKKFGLFPKKKQRKGISLWRNKRRDLVPSLNGLGNALMQATENINGLLDNWATSRLIPRVREKVDCYKVRYHLPGLKKEDVKITVADGVLNIKGEHKEEDETESEEDEYWGSAGFYGYYDTVLALPPDAKADEIKADMKDGVLTVIIPRTESAKKDVKEVHVQ